MCLKNVLCGIVEWESEMGWERQGAIIMVKRELRLGASLGIVRWEGVKIQKVWRPTGWVLKPLLP